MYNILPQGSSNRRLEKIYLYLEGALPVGHHQNENTKAWTGARPRARMTVHCPAVATDHSLCREER